MIRVESVQKSFGPHLVLKNLSFEIQKGEIVGFIGRNGAGKTTTLRVLSGFLEPDKGKVLIAGHAIRDARREALSQIGYMPEQSPLLDEMRVVEYLRYRGQIKGVTRMAIRERNDIVMEQLGIQGVSRKLIGRLSRGFRQRVALADALIADPKVLLLDEPSAGLDPLQRHAFGELLTTLAKDRCILFSTHLLSEVTALVSRFLLLDKGELIADGNMTMLRTKACLGKNASTEEIFTALVCEDEQ